MGKILITVYSVNHLVKVETTLVTVCLGAFGNVRIGWLKSNPQHMYAIKTMKKKEIIDSKHVDHIENEKKILEKMDHPFGVSLQSLKITAYLQWIFLRLTVHILRY